MKSVLKCEVFNYSCTVANISEAVLEALLPYINEIKDDLSCVKNDLTTLNKTVSNHEDHMTTELMNLHQNLEQNFTLQLKNSYGYITPYQCGGTGGWRRVVYLDMTDPNTNCPSGWQLTSHSKRTCGRVSSGITSYTCDSVTFPVSGGVYTRVCGRIKGYGTPNAFAAYNFGFVATIDDAYVSGVSLTHGSPRQHIWTFAAGISEYFYHLSTSACPCDATIDITIPPYVGGDYFCESGWNSGSY